ncbi:MAG: DUF1654 domain-containing protein [Halomonas sp.]|jgi:hypothetical protein|uniref:DUF1654 domain-containing protein n=1 Tax=Vreelandella aquamarina TaxID=77097 RepID=UPI0009C0E78B|nr:MULTISPECIES: DUF1654 domain-containing protein [Halomonas]MDK2750595.1 DUF1654 domain-containing protein [Halomonas meridiana]NQY77259.1 DUF1654 domain-containing protein [Halomonas sp.]HBM45211.1 DUF1654 domain-containing protein [Halomonas sp.]HBP79219.1 DUF1654 domain-containing protein [Halomonas sp.]|tara:strand:- start:12 stop:191 length:180 start_codon:yes stop_codon:yes gene_type:complete
METSTNRQAGSPTIVFERKPEESHDDWDRMISEMEASEAVAVWRFTDGSIGLKRQQITV